MTSILVMDPRNGEVLGMASSNPYDLNDPMNEEELLQLYSQEEIDKMKEYTEEKESEESSEDEADEASTEENEEDTTAEDGSEASTEEEEEAVRHPQRRKKKIK